MNKIIFIVFLSVVSLSIQAASLTFLTVHPGTGTGYTKSTNSITWSATYNAASGYSSLKFVSANPADVTFSGNDVAGQFSYYFNNQKYIINGVVSRPAKTGNTPDAYYFFESTVLGGNLPTGKAWLFVVPGRESAVATSPTSTSSDPVSTAMNSLLTTQNGYADPVITSNGGGATVSLSIAENISAVTTVTASVYSGSTKTFSISGGVDAAKFTINASTGALTFVTPPDYENPTDAGLNNVYDVQVTVTDGQGTTDMQAIAVTVTNTNDNSPVITSNGGGSTASVPVLAGTTAVTTVTATDADYGDVLTYSISGGTHSGLFSINPSSGALSFKSAAVAGSYQVIVTVTDANGNADLQTLSVNVTATDTTAPSVVISSSDSNLSAGEACTISFKFSELVQGFTLSDVNYTGGTLTGLTQSATDPTLYTATFTQSGTSVANPTFNIAANTYQDLASPTPNNGTAATQLTLNADWTPPTVGVTFSSTTISTGESKIVTFTFSENPGNSFSTSDITVTNATLSDLMQTADPKVWTATILSTSARYSPVVTVINQSYTDLAGNPGSSGTNTLRLVPPAIDLANDPVSDTGVSSSDNITTNRKPIISGKNNNALAFTSVLVQYYVNTTLTTLTYTTGTGITYNAADSTFTIDLSIATPTSGTMPAAGLPEGYVTLNLTTSTGALASNSFLIDLTAPTPVPTVTAMAATYDATPTISGTATVLDNEILRVTVNGITYTNGDGNLSLNGTAWTLNITTANRISAGTHNVTATVTDAAGNASTDATSNELVINASNVTIDLKNSETDDTGTSSSDNVTSNRSPILNGNSSGSDTSLKVTVVSGGVTYTYNSVNVSGGTYSLDLSTAIPSSIIPTGSFPAAGLPSGTVNLTVEGNTSGATGTNSFVIDYIAPATPAVNSQSTYNTKPTITGTGSFVAGDILKVTINGVTYTSGDGNLSYNAGAGTWSLTIPNGNALSVGSYPTTATITDLSGNISATGSGTTTITAATVTADLANTSASDTGTSSTDNLTSNRKPVITGTASGDAVVTVTVTSGGTTYTYNNVAVSGGTWSLDLSTASVSSGTAFPGTGLTTGTWTLEVTGNTTAATGSNTFVEDYTAPTSPTVNSQSTWDTTPTITGSATVGAGDILRVTINGITYTNGDGDLSFSGGTWTLNVPAQDALSVTAFPTSVTVTDAAGNVANGSGTTTITPATISIDLANTPESDTGVSSSDNVTTNRKPIIVGTAASDATVTVTILSGGITYTFNNVSVVGGSWSLNLATASTTSGAALPALGLAEGVVSLTVTGNSTSASQSNSYQLNFVSTTTADGTWTTNTKWDSELNPNSQEAIAVVKHSITIPESQVVECKDLTIDTSGKLINNATLTINDSLILKVGSNNAASSVTNNGQVINNGQIIIRKTFSRDFGWYFMSFPFDVPASRIFIAGTNTVARWGDPTLSSTSTKDFYVSEYDGAKRDNTGVVDYVSNSPNWKDVNPHTFIAKKGYIVAVPGDITIDFVSGVGETSIFEPISTVDVVKYENNAYNYHKSWNLIGIPYATSYKLNLATQVPFYSYNKTQSNYDVVMTAIDEYVINPYYSFFMQASNTSIDFSTSGRLAVKSKVSNPEYDEINLILKNATYFDKTRIRLERDASTGYVIGSDAVKMFSDVSAVPQIYSQIGNYPIAYNTLPTTINSVDLTAKIGVRGNYSIKLSYANRAPGYSKIILVDNLLNKQQDLLVDSVYNFYSEVSTAKRFKVLLTNSITTDVSNETVGNIYASVSNHNVRVNGLDESATVYAFTLTGELISIQKDIVNDKPFKLNYEGVVILKIYQKQSTVSLKLNL